MKKAVKAEEKEIISRVEIDTIERKKSKTLKQGRDKGRQK